MKWYVIPILFLFCVQSFSQDEIGAFCVDSTYCIPSIEGSLRPKGVLFQNEYGTVKIKGDGKTLTAANRLSTYKIKAPIILKDNFKFTIGLFHFHEDFQFDSKTPISEALSGEKNDFKSYGLNTYILKPFLGNKYISFRTSTSIAGPTEGGASQFLKYSVSMLKGVKKDENTIIGWGGVFRYSMGDYFGLPLFYYIKNLNSHWNVQLQLPISARLRWVSLNRKNVIQWENKFSGGRYRLRNESTISNTLYTSTDLNSILVYEREIYDFLWFNIYGGYKQNVRADLFGTDYRLQRGIIYGFSLFIVPPRKFSY